MATTILVLTFVALTLLVSSPLIFPRSPGDAAGRALAAERGVPLIYWRAGCTFCIRLRFALGGAGRRAVWVNIHRDPAAAARVRSVNDGDETVPTVFVGDSAHTNPPPSWVRGALRR